MTVTKLTDLELHEVSLVGRGANQGAKLTLFKSNDKEDEQMEELEKQIQDLTKKNEELTSGLEKAAETNTELVKSLEEAQASIEPIEKELDKNDVTDPRILKALEDGETAKAKVEEMTKQFDDFKKTQLVKEIEGEVEKYGSVFEKQDEAVEVLAKMDVEMRDFVFEAVAKTAEIIKDAADKISKELGNSGDEVGIVDQVEKDAKELMKNDSKLTIQKARTQVVENLSTDERNEYSKGGN